MIEVKVNTDIIKLDSFLKWCGAVSLGSEGKIYIQNGEVLVNGEIETRRGRKLRIGDIVEIHGEIYKLSE